MDAVQVSLALALCAAAGAGSGDYLAARAARQAPVLRVAAWVQVIGLLIVLAACLGDGRPNLDSSDAALSLAGGLAIALGLASLYGALAIGPIGITAPVAAIVGAALPVVFDAGSQHHLSLRHYAGLFLGLLAVGLLAAAPSQPAAGTARHGVIYALLAGIGIGVYTVALDASRPESGMWPLAVARTVAAMALLLIPLRPAHAGHAAAPLPWRAISAAGMLDGASMVAFLAALRAGQMGIVAVITALYPAFTMGLAIVIDRERVRLVQVAGIVAAATAVTLISWSG